jgi:hypothetical protein
MSEPRSPFLRIVQQPQFWVPCSAALLTLVFLGKWVLDPETELPEVPGQEGIVSDRAQQDLTTEESVVGSDIDNLEVLLNELDFQPTTLEQNIEPLAPPTDSSETSLSLPSSSLNPPDSGKSANLNATPDPLTRSAQLRNFFNPTGAESAPSLTQVTGGEDGTLNLSLRAAPAQPLFGSPQPLGLPQSLTVTNLPTSPTENPLGQAPQLYPSSVAPYPYNTGSVTSGGVPAPGTVAQPSANYAVPVNPYNFAPYGAGTVNTGFSSTPNGGVISPYSLDPSFRDPLVSPLGINPQSRPSLAPGQYIGNGEINTFANP